MTHQEEVVEFMRAAAAEAGVGCELRASRDGREGAAVAFTSKSAYGPLVDRFGVTSDGYVIRLQSSTGSLDTPHDKFVSKVYKLTKKFAKSRGAA